jgi:hypothetical protein
MTGSILERITPACQARIADSSSTNAVSFSSARAIRRSPSLGCASAMKIVRPFDMRIDSLRRCCRLVQRRGGLLTPFCPVQTAPNPELSRKSFCISHGYFLKSPIEPRTFVTNIIGDNRLALPHKRPFSEPCRRLLTAARLLPKTRPPCAVAAVAAFDWAPAGWPCSWWVHAIIQLSEPSGAQPLISIGRSKLWTRYFSMAKMRPKTVRQPPSVSGERREEPPARRCCPTRKR